MKITAYHATRQTFDVLDPSKTIDGGLHFGTREQALVRGGGRSRLLAADLTIEKVRRSRDKGGEWASKIKSAKKAGYDAIVYLNRYEGISRETVDAAFSKGLSLDSLTDAEFRRQVPEAHDSWIVFDVDKIRMRPDLYESPKKPPGFRPG